MDMDRRGRWLRGRYIPARDFGCSGMKRDLIMLAAVLVGSLVFLFASVGLFLKIIGYRGD
jgi:hypothetical protein